MFDGRSSEAYQQIMLTVRIAAGRSTSFYGKYESCKQQAYQEFEDPLSQIRITSFRRWADRLYTTASWGHGITGRRILSGFAVPPGAAFFVASGAVPVRPLGPGEKNLRNFSGGAEKVARLRATFMGVPG